MKQLEKEENAQQPTSGLASVGVSARGQFSAKFGSSPPVATLVKPRPNAKPRDVISNAGDSAVRLGSEKIRFNKVESSV